METISVDTSETKPPSESNSVRTLVLVGKTGNGKSSTANSILGTKLCQAKLSMSSVTTVVTKHASNDNTIEIIDTPGLFDTSLGHDVIGKEIVKCLDLAPNGIDAVLVVLSVRGRFTEDEQAAIYCLQALFGSKIFDYVIVVFTGGDDIKVEEGEDDKNGLSNHIRSGAPRSLTDILKLCGNREVLFDNRTEIQSKKCEQVQQLLSVVDKVLEENGGEPYSHKHFGKDGTVKLHGKNDGILGEIALMKEDIQKKYDEQLKQITAKMEADLQEATKELEEENKKAGEKAAELNAQADAMAEELNILKAMVEKSKKRAEKAHERVEKANNEIAERDRNMAKQLEIIHGVAKQNDERAEKAHKRAEKMQEILELAHERAERERVQAAKEANELMEKVCTNL